MNSLIHLFKELYAYCTDFIINLANITGLSYYEVNFVIFIVIYPLLVIITPTFFVIQKLRLRTIKNHTISMTKRDTKNSFNYIKTFNKRNIFISANIAWIFIIVLGTSRALIESTHYYGYHLSLSDDGLIPIDTISLIFDETHFVFLILSTLLIFLNIFILLTTRKTNLPTKLFIKADFFIGPVVLWELFFGLCLAISLFLFFYWFWIEYYFEGLITLYFTFILLNLRAGQISKYKKTTENASL
jgi:hypothetical protein